MTAPDLKPCPFCGQTDFLTLHAVGSLLGSMPDRPYQVRCRHLDCEDVQGPVAYGREAAIAIWNTRTPDPAAIREALFSLPAVYAHQINTGVREVYDPLQRFYTMESVLSAITEATK